MNNVVAIVQARMGSIRLRGKVLADIGGRSMLARVCDRLRQATRVDQIVVATTLDPEDDGIVAQCDRLRVPCFRGSAEDVLDRYHQVANRLAADLVVRITADCPLIDPEVVDLVVGALLKEAGGQAPDAGEVGAASGSGDPAPGRLGRQTGRDPWPCYLPPDYASNTLRRTWPRGLDTEVMTAAALGRAWQEASQPHDRAHVTPYIYRHPELFRLLPVTGPEDRSDGRWTVDWPEDLDFVRAVYGRLGGDQGFSWRDVQALLRREPALAELNRHVPQKQLVEG